MPFAAQARLAQWKLDLYRVGIARKAEAVPTRSGSLIPRERAGERRESPGLTLAGRGTPGNVYCPEARVLKSAFPYIIDYLLGLYSTALGLYTIPPLGSQRKMAPTSKEKLDLVNRTKKIIGQLEAVLQGLHGDEQCADLLHRLAAARGSINSLMAELLEDHIRNHMPKNSKSAEEAAEEVIDVVRTYLK